RYEWKNARLGRHGRTRDCLAVSRSSNVSRSSTSSDTSGRTRDWEDTEERETVLLSRVLPTSRVLLRLQIRVEERETGKTRKNARLSCCLAFFQRLAFFYVFRYEWKNARLGRHGRTRDCLAVSRSSNVSRSSTSSDTSGRTRDWEDTEERETVLLSRVLPTSRV